MHGPDSSEHSMLHAPEAAWCCAGIPECEDSDELPAFQNESYAALFEVIAPVRHACRVRVPAGYTSRVGGDVAADSGCTAVTVHWWGAGATPPTKGTELPFLGIMHCICAGSLA